MWLGQHFVFIYEIDNRVVLIFGLILFMSLLQYGRTEMIKDSLNPDFVKKFLMEYYFEVSQKLTFEM